MLFSCVKDFFFIIQPHFVSIDNRYYFTHADEWWYMDGLINVVSNQKITKLGTEYTHTNMYLRMGLDTKFRITNEKKGKFQFCTLNAWLQLMARKQNGLVMICCFFHFTSFSSLVLCVIVVVVMGAFGRKTIFWSIIYLFFSVFIVKGHWLQQNK